MFSGFLIIIVSKYPFQLEKKKLEVNISKHRKILCICTKHILKVYLKILKTKNAFKLSE